MKNILIYMVFSMLIFACVSEKEKQDGSISNKGTNKKNTDVLKDTLDFEYKEWYPGRAQLKIEGSFDKNSQRHGKWVSYNTAGKELSMTTYTHGLKQGYSIVKYQNGAIYYRGEYTMDEKTGLWTFYNKKGEVSKEINYDSE